MVTPGERNARIRAAAKTAAEKSAAAKDRKKRKRLRTDAGSAAELHVEWSTAYRRKFGAAPVAWGPAERSLAKRLVTEHGFERAVDVVRRFFESWDVFPNKSDAPPVLKVMWYRVADLVADLDGVKPLRSRTGWSVADAEYREDSSPSEGWGDGDSSPVQRLPDEEF